MKCLRPHENKKTIELVNALFVLNTCRIPKITEVTPRIISVAKYNKTATEVSNFFIKHTFYKYFCGGESSLQVGSLIKKFRKDNVKSILDLAIEENTHDIVPHILTSIDIAKVQENNFVSIKLSAIVPEADLILGECSLDSFIKLHKICSYALKENVMLMIDAEHSIIQTTINDIAIRLAEVYNKESCVIWNTYQMYLRGSLQRLKSDISKTNLGVKLVRGAYISTEKPEIIHSCIQKTHDNYNSAVDYCIDYIKKDNSPTKIQVMIATHNGESVNLAIEKLKGNKNLAKFGQLLGIKDDLTARLSNDGYQVYKYIPYGPVDTAIPYLIRRAQENNDVLNSVSGDVELYYKELIYRLCRRIKNLIFFYK